MLLTIIVLLWIAFSFGGIAYVRKNNKLKQERDKVLIDEFKDYDKEFHGENNYSIGLDYKTKIAFNKELQQFRYYQRNSDNGFEIYPFSFEDVLNVEFSLNGAVVSKVSRSEQIGGALIGGAIAGNVGALIGGLSGSRTESEQIHRATLKVTTTNLDNPVLYVEFLPPNNPNAPQGFSRNGEIMQAVIRNLEKWEGIFKIAMNTSTSAS